MQSSQRLLKYGFISVFVTVLTLPLVTHMLSPVLRLDSDILQENRTLAQLSVPKDMAALRAFPGTLQNWISDNFGLRKLLIYINNNIVYQVFGDIPRFRKQVVRGSDGYIFLSSHSSDLPMDLMLEETGLTRKSAPDAKAWEVLLEMSRTMSDRMVFVSVPTKHLLFTEFFPAWLRDRAVPQRDEYVAAMNQLQQAAGGKLLFPYTEAKALGASHQLIPRTFFHWVSGPYTQLVAGLVARHFGIAPLESEPFNDFVTVRQTSDIQHMYPGLSIFESEVEQYPAGYFDRKGIRMEKFAPNGVKFSPEVEKNMPSSYVRINPAQTAGNRLLAIGDSFLWPSMDDFSIYFSGVLHINNNELRQLDPEQARQYIDTVLTHFKPTHAMILSHLGYKSMHAEQISDYLKQQEVETP